MDILSLLIIVLVFAIIFWVLTLLPIDANAKKILNTILALVFVLWLVGALFPGFFHLRIGVPQ